MTLKEVWINGKKFLKNEFETNKLDFSLIFQEIFGLNRLELVLYGDKQAEKFKIDSFFKMLQRKKNGEPLQYIIGHQEFYGLDLKIGNGVLIPRKDTETLVKVAVEMIDLQHNSLAKLNIVDLCSGSGAIALALKKEFKLANVTAIEISPQAFYFIKKNIANTNINIKAILGDIFKVYDDFKNSSLDLIISNPPYISTNDLFFLEKEVKFEPKIALDGGHEGLDFYFNIIKKWSVKLKKGAIIAFEVGFDQSNKVFKILKESGFNNITIKKDLNGINRVVIAMHSQSRPGLTTV
ncbi:MAG: peptide chain release factor N(5)-glutamine methyltransferase [Oscillospiraceae bacterium]|jgi:release factor glutamine methyltransferase|nr:peptide chain release factor N(5)-glutamine methyltransferase [Oscillospiraceae bacterium]